MTSNTPSTSEPVVSMKSLLEAGVHFGHQTHRWNPKMARYIYGSRNNIHIIDLQKTVRELKKALVYVRSVAAQGKSVLFVGTKRQSQEAIVQEARRCDSPYVSERWLGGTLTNFETIRKSTNRFQELLDMKEKGILNRLSKKERAGKEKDIQRLTKSLEGIKNMTELPGCIFIVDISNETTAVLEGKKLGIPLVAVCDTNTDPDDIDYPIPGNDDAIRAIRLISSLVAESIITGRKNQEEEMMKKAAADMDASSAEAAKSDDVADVSTGTSEENPSVSPQSV